MLIKNIPLGILNLIKLDAQNELLGHSGKRGVDVSRKKKKRTPTDFRRAGFINSGDVLLSRNLEMHYHWGCSVSLPCSEWERVGPLRYNHQKAGEAEASPWGNRQGRSLLNFARKSGDCVCRDGFKRLEVIQSPLTARLT